MYDHQNYINKNKKPFEPTFKVGDWAVHPESGNVIHITSTNLVHGTDHFEPWVPTPNEWCWFWDLDTAIPSLAKFDSKLKTLSAHRKYLAKGTCWKYCEPFIGTLPQSIKD